MDLLRVFTLGGLRFLRGEQPVARFETRKAEALLVYLVCNRRTHPREILANLLWDERSQEQAMANLRVVLTSLRKHLEPYLVITRESVSLNPEAQIWTDVAELEERSITISGTGGIGSEADAQHIQGAIDLYMGDFLEGFYVRESRGFDEWMVRERERLHRLVVDALHGLVEHDLQSGSYARGVASAGRLLELDALDELAHRQMMLLLAYSGKRSEALAQFEASRKLLSDELGIEPSPPTRELYEKIRSGEMGMETPEAIKAGGLGVPSGTVTFLFTDIEGSTQLLHRLREGYAAVLVDQRRILREAFAIWHGHEVDTQGDAFFVSFSRATQAMGAAAEAQRKLAGHTWPEGVVVRVRMGIHTGEPWSAEEGYVGMDVHRAARIARVGHGGQVLLSETATALVQDELPPGVSLADLGRHLLKDIHRPERICQLVIEGLPSEFPPLTSLEALPAEGARQPRRVGTCPYRGLAAFQEPDAAFYFGRETFVSSLEQAVRTRKLVAVIVGSSGSGKSSALFAGLLPRLRASGGYQFAIFHPGSQPFYALAGALLSILDSGLSKTDLLAETRKLAERLAKGEISLSQVTGRLLEKAPDTRHILLVVDQFEELYTLCPETKLQVAFIDKLLAAVEASRLEKDAPSVILLTLRADFMGQALAHRPFADALQEASLLMGPMTRQELHMAVEKPAEIQGAAFEPGLVERFLDDVGEKPGNLPLLEFTLTQLWEQQTDGWLTHADYEAMGSVEGALSAYADQVYSDLDAAEQESTRRALVQLVQPGEGTEDTRRIATREELGDDSWSLIQRLADRRLVVTGRDAAGREIAEVVHEALIQKWGHFQEWMSSDRAFRLWQERLRGSLRQWQESGEDKGALLSGAPLAVAQNWLAERGGDLSPSETKYIEASLADRQARNAAESARQQRELETARKLAETEKNRSAEHASAARRLRRRALFLAGAACLAALLAVAAGLIAITANNNARQSSAHQLASAAEAGLGVDSGQSISLALQSLQIQPMVDTYSILHRTLFSSHLRASIQALHGDAVYIAISPAGDRLATSGGDPGEVKVWRVNGAVIDPAPLLTLEGLIQQGGCKNPTSTDLMFSPDGSRLAVSYCGTYISLVDARTGELIRRFTPDWEETTGLGFSPDGRWLAAFGMHGQVTLWDVENGQNLLTFQAHEPGQGPIAMNCFDFSPDGRRLATGGKDGELKLWSLERGTGGMQATLIAQVVQKNEGFVRVLRFNPDGHKLAEATAGAIHILDLAPLVSGLPGAELVKIPINNNKVRLNSIYFTPAGDHLVTTQLGSLKYSGSGGVNQLENEIQIWDATTGFLLLSILPEQQLMAGVISPDGQTFYTAHVGGEIHSWDISNLGSPEGLAAPAGGNGGALNLSPDGKRLLEMNRVDLEGGKYQFTWQRVDGSQVAPIDQFTISLGERQAMVLVDKNLSRIVALDLQNLCRVFNAANGELLTTFQFDAVSPWGSSVVVNADASQLLMMMTINFPTDTLMEVWDIPAGRRLFQFHIPDSGFISAFSPDGKAIVTYYGNQAANLIRWWDPATGQKIKEMDLGQGPIIGVVFTPDDKFWLSWGEDQTVKIHEASTDRLVRTLSPAAQITSVMVSPDNHTIAVSLSTSQTTLYSFEDGRELVTLPGASIDFLPDRPAVLNLISGDPTVYAFISNNNDLVRLACERLKNITPSNGVAPELKICQDKSK